ncbi:uncharacterized protein LOC120273109 [Dioscorea cayenensis subsp. rotundata]|uniref:Uncharacterized protein LOC120273109 n=1 Tax=Dioscorea cayennensis subsp. rotundata TaxID=55577 RepID=A0AB40CBJ1_DIOCR|nr:uncharacterized protein LOC120273109 [Dioscorea cayenensis subsp. rotundata]
MFNEYKDLKKCELYVTLVDATPYSVQEGGQRASNLEVRDMRESQSCASNDRPILTQTNIDANHENINIVHEEDYGQDDDLVEQIDSETSYHLLYNSESNDESSDESNAKEGQIQIDGENQSIKICSLFVDCYLFRRALEKYSILREFSIKYIKSDQSRVTARCVDYKCSWMVHASIVREQGAFQESDLSAKELRRRLNEKYNMDLPYHRVWRGKEEVVSTIHGNWEDSYMKIIDFKDELMRRNRGSIVKIDKESKEGKSHFKRMFICLGPCSKGFLLGCRPFLGLDGCHLKGKYKGVMAAASAIDKCNQLFPLAYGILELENIESWTWFLNGLYEAIGLPNGLVLASDRQKGLEEAICRVYPSVEHRTCVRHMYKNLKKKFCGKSLRRSVWAAARSYTVRGYNTAIEDIKSINIRAYNWIEDLGKKLEIWRRSQCSIVCKCDYITNNISESLSAWVAEARERPVLDLLDTIRQKIMVTMDKIIRMATKWKDDIEPSVKKYVRNLSRGLAAYEVQHCSDSKAEVSYKGQRCEVLLTDGICSCRKWQVFGIPCVHAMAFIFSIRGAKWEEYVDLYFLVEKTTVAYNLEIAPMPNINQ